MRLHIRHYLVEGIICLRNLSIDDRQVLHLSYDEIFKQDLDFGGMKFGRLSINFLSAA